MEKANNADLKRIIRLAYTAITMLAIALSLSVATYAWFTTNSVTTTQKASGRSDVDSVQLLLSASGPGNFNGSSEASILQVNKSGSVDLLPVSTVDLQTFLFNPGTVEDNATYFEKVSDEKYIYHGRIYLQAAAKGHPDNAKVQLYLDEDETNGGKLMKNVQGYILNSSRLGLVIDNDKKYILKFSDDKNPEGAHIDNTKLNGELLPAGNVLTIDAEGNIKAAADPSVLYTEYLVPANGLAGNKAKPLLVMDLNRVYTMDIYFYMEGCDPDCTSIAETDNLDFHLGFYGILTEEVN